ncbi:MAG: transporter [Thermodesulfovibrionales bacterium]
MFSSAKRLLDESEIHAQLGYTIVTNSKDSSLRNFFFYGAALDWAMTKPFHFVTEFDGNKHPDPTLGYQNISLFGFTYEISKHLTIDVSYKKGLSNSAPSWGFGFGAAIEY